jgi:large subunit ribosomal protein L23
MSLLSFAKKIAGAKDSSTTKKTATKAAVKKSEQAPSDVTTPVVPVNIVHLTPLITEKSMTRQGENNTYMFRVRPEISKGQITAAVVARYGVTPASIRTLMMSPRRRSRGATIGATNAWKKAYVTLPAGKTIDVNA